MKNALLSELFGDAHRLALLQVLYINPTREFTATEVATLAKVDPGNALRWLKKWADVGLVERTQVLTMRRLTPRSQGSPTSFVATTR